MSEANVMRSIMIAVSKTPARLFRNNIALAWVGQTSGPVKASGMVRVNPGDVVIRKARPLHAGLVKGSGDLIGPTPVVVTAEMVGSTLAVFTSIEVKDQGGRQTPEQRRWDGWVNSVGGISGVAYSDSDALALVGKYDRSGSGRD
jgi:hypothetical protein